MKMTPISWQSACTAIASEEEEPPVIMMARSASIMRFAVARAASAFVCVSPETKVTFLPLIPAPVSAFEELNRRLLEAGEDPNRYNPRGGHSHTTPIHQAALQGHAEVVRVLAEHGARLDLRDTIYHGTPLGWAVHGGRNDVAEYLRSLGASQ